ncbi:MAG: hypothetical protein N3I86_05065 [Verrucomicrobiae bacterium]|nr:hypothetical protein [Verrucomicrobiae bacterium]
MKVFRLQTLIWVVGFAAVVVLAQLLTSARKAPSQRTETDVAIYDEESHEAEKALGTDPSWKPLLEEIGVIQLGRSPGGGSVQNYCLDGDGKLLVCRGGSFSRVKDPTTRRTEVVNEPAEVCVFSPSGECLNAWPQPCKLQAICVSPNGHIFAAGSGRVLRLDAEGRVVASVETPVANAPVAITPEIEEILKQQNRLNPTELEKMKKSLERRRADVPGIAATETDVFVVCPTPSDFAYRIYRFDHDLKESKLVLEKLRGCCGQLDIQAHDGRLWVAHNGRHRVEAYDREGRLLSQFGKRGRVRPEDFGGCCEPKNVRIAPDGDVLAAESGPPSCIKRFTAEGRFLGVVAIAESMKGDCVRMTVAVSPDGSRYYLLDTTKDVVRVFGKRS